MWIENLVPDVMAVLTYAQAVVEAKDWMSAIWPRMILTAYMCFLIVYFLMVIGVASVAIIVAMGVVGKAACFGVCIVFCTSLCLAAILGCVVCWVMWISVHALMAMCTFVQEFFAQDPEFLETSRWWAPSFIVG